MEVMGSGWYSIEVSDSVIILYLATVTVIVMMGGIDLPISLWQVTVTGLTIFSFAYKPGAHSGNFWTQTSHLIEPTLKFYSGEKHWFQFL